MMHDTRLLSAREVDRFWVKVDQRTGDCWLWTAARQSLGYGHFWLRGVMVPAHRVSFEALRGPIPAGMTIDHLCKVRHCVNPAHMEAVTLRENIARSDSPPAENGRKATCAKGHSYQTIRSGARKGERWCPTCRNERRLRVSAA